MRWQPDCNSNTYLHALSFTPLSQPPVETNVQMPRGNFFMPAGYSGTPLAKKLGIKAGCRVLVENAPGTFRAALEPLPDDVVFLDTLTSDLDMIHLFTDRA